MEVLRLYPEYQQEFANDIQHDLTFNMREGYEAEAESDIGPSLVLPSISEDDENQSESEVKICPKTPPNNSVLRSPLHTATSPRHAKFLQRYGFFKVRFSCWVVLFYWIRCLQFFSIFSGRSLATLRERVERQRSVSSSVNNGSESNSLEGLNLERGESHQSQTKGKSIERLDSRVSTLHQDVAALSMEVSFESPMRPNLIETY